MELTNHEIMALRTAICESQIHTNRNEFPGYYKTLEDLDAKLAREQTVKV